MLHVCRRRCLCIAIVCVEGSERKAYKGDRGSFFEKKRGSKKINLLQIIEKRADQIVNHEVDTDLYNLFISIEGVFSTIRGKLFD